MRKKIVVCGGCTGGHVFPAVTFTEFFKEKDYETILITDERGKKFLKKDFVYSVDKFKEADLKKIQDVPIDSLFNAPRKIYCWFPI